MAKITIKPQALSQFDEIVKSVIEFTGFETSGIRLQSDIFDKIEQIAFMPLSGRAREDGQEKLSSDVIVLCTITIGRQMK